MKSKVISVRVTPELEVVLKQLASSEGRTVGAIGSALFAEYAARQRGHRHVPDAWVVNEPGKWERKKEQAG